MPLHIKVNINDMRDLSLYSLQEFFSKSIMVVLTASDIGPNISVETLEYKRKYHMK